MRRVVLHALVAFSVAAVAYGKSGGPVPGPRGDAGRWTRIEMVERYSFEGNVVEDKDLSGLAFVSDRFGLLGADEARQVQVVELSRPAKTLRILETISLPSARPRTEGPLRVRAARQAGAETDIEAIAADGDCYYIVGSHGAAKASGQHQENRYRIFRLQVDPETGKPRGPAARALKSATLADVLRSDPVLGAHFAQSLQRRGVNIEGLAARDGRLYIGFRSPNLQGDAFVMEIRADDVFGSVSKPAYTLHRLRLGPGLGIRELVATQSSFLLIASNAGSEPSPEYPESQDYEKNREFFLFQWDGKNPAVQNIGALPKTSGQAEAMTILQETKDALTVLVLFDGPSGGQPTVYRIS